MTDTTQHGATGSQSGPSAPEGQGRILGRAATDDGTWVMVSPRVAVNLAHATAIDFERGSGTATIYFDGALRQSIRCDHPAGSVNVRAWIQLHARPLPALDEKPASAPEKGSDQ